MDTKHTPQLNHLSPVLIVDRVEPCMTFWVNRFGFTAENQVPGPDGSVVFASVKKGNLELMYQTRASVEADEPGGAAALAASSVLFVTVADLNDVESALADVPVVKPRHTTFYGSTELYVREPGGHVVGFAQF